MIDLPSGRYPSPSVVLSCSAGSCLLCVSSFVIFTLDSHISSSSTTSFIIASSLPYHLVPDFLIAPCPFSTVDHDVEDDINSSDIEILKVLNSHVHRRMQTIKAMVATAFDDKGAAGE